MPPKKIAPPKDLDKDAWIDVGLAAILDGGLAAVAVEPLARKLGVTKGSFYWHFRDRNALLEAMAERWSERTEALIAQFAGIANPAERLQALIVAVHRSQDGVRTMRTMSALAAHPSTGARIRGVAERQLTFLAQAFAELGLNSQRAHAAAKLVHAAALGVGELDPLGLGFGSAAERTSYVAELLAFVSGVAK